MTADERAEYDAWLRQKVQAPLDHSNRPDLIFYSPDEVMRHVEELLDKLDREAGIK